MNTEKQDYSTETLSGQGSVIGSNRYFLYVGKVAKNHYLETNKVYKSDAKYNENDTIIDYIDFSLTNGFDCDDFVELRTINSSIGGLILALKSLCNDYGLKCEVKVYE